jgi:acyl-CoA dehydrogenase
MQWENEGAIPEGTYQKFASANMLIPNLPAPLPVEYLKKVGIHKIGPLKVEDFDNFHGSIYVSEIIRSGLNGPASSLCTGIAYGTPPLLKFASRELQERVVPDILLGRKRICIAITEPDAGSDVANVQATAKRSQCGKFYVINGIKKWITNAIWSDYASMCVRTGGPGPGGLSVVLVPLKGQKGVSMRRIPVSGQKCAGTTMIELDDVQVPVENLIGREGEGMKQIMTNFNHERLTIAVKVTTQARVALAEAFKYCMKREAFGQPLMNQPVVRHRLAKAGALLETQWSWVEAFVYQMLKLPKDVADAKLGGLTALAKAQAAIVLNECSQCAQLLFGGNGYTQTGQGELIEKISREVAGARIPVSGAVLGVNRSSKG